MDKDREDQPLSSEELLRQAREGLGSTDAAPDAPADFSIESYPPPASDSTFDDVEQEPAFAEPTFPEPTPSFEEPTFSDRDEPASWAPPPANTEADEFGALMGGDPAPTRRSGSGIGRILIVLAVLAVIGVGVFSLLDSSKTVDDIAVGDCLDIPEEDVFSTIDTIECTEPHDLEVFALVDLSNVSVEFSSAASYPGDTAVYDAAFDACWDEFEFYVGVPYEDSVLYMDAFTPTLEGWDEQGDRIVNCVLYEVNADATELIKSSRSLRNANR